jgi:peptidoglycan/xylan/chitin deacetylase (PgdA/CDA1 family)
VRFRPLVLCYHAISERWNDPLAILEAAFERQLRLLLSRGRIPIDLEGVLSNRRGTFHVTFDDAYRSMMTAVPLLERLGVRATVFVCTEYARDGRPFVVPELRGRVGEEPHELSTMSWDELRDLAARGVGIGSHTVSHPHLPELTDAELRREVADSREEIEAALSQPCRFLAYPYGDDDERVHTAACDAGYLAAFTLRGSVLRANQYALPRIDIYRRDRMLRFAAKASRAGPASLSALTAIRRFPRR